MTAPGARDVAEEITDPPPETRRGDIPTAWADRPEAWWSHVEQCCVCSKYFERP